MDKISKTNRSQNMSKIRSKNTKPELLVRKALWKMGYRYRIHYTKIPGRPDIVMPKYKLVILVHGCFWHRHKNCIEASRPKSNIEFWENKINKNIERDNRVKAKLIEMGWDVLIVWECELSMELQKNMEYLKRLLDTKINRKGIQ